MVNQSNYTDKFNESLVNELQVNTHQVNVPEILAPAGSSEAFYAAVNNGCDAIYLGGKNFGARAYATNFEEEELLKAISFAHLYNVKVYYTLNTLVKDIEIKLLNNELEMLRRINIDAVIIQDFGVYEYIKENFNDLVIHGSTQMNLHSIEDVRFAQQLGFERVVLSRECSLDDIRKIKKLVDIEVETFVHGALCYCYSGQCLMSSIYGGRSGNRGKCAQPCRLPYIVDDETGYYLSPKDQMTLMELPELILSGIDSFKIEGRMKSAQYVGFTTFIYKKYRDLALQLIKEDKIHLYKVAEEDLLKLNQLYNRGHFTEGYYHQHNSREMLSINHSKHLGVKVGKVTYSKDGFTFNFHTVIHVSDLLELHIPVNPLSGESWPAIQMDKELVNNKLQLKNIYTSDQKKIDVARFEKGKSYDVYRIRDKDLNIELEKYSNNTKKLTLEAHIIGKVGHPLRIEVSGDFNVNNKVHISLEKSIVEASVNKPTDESAFLKQLSKTGDTYFEFSKITFDLDPLIFVPVSLINEIRREAIVAFETELLIIYNNKPKNSLKRLYKDVGLHNNIIDNLIVQEINYHIYIETFIQLKEVLEYMDTPSLITRIYLDMNSFSSHELKNHLEQIRLKNPRVSIYLALPHVVFEAYKDGLADKILAINNNLYDGFLVRTIGEISIAVRFKKNFVIDYNMNVFNQYAVNFYKKLGATEICLSLELNQKGIEDITEITPKSFETIIYGATGLMHSANCIYKTTKGRCDYKEAGHELTMSDRKNENLVVKTHCQMCYNTLYNGKATFLMDLGQSIDTIKRIDFTYENQEETKDILKQLDLAKMNLVEMTFNERRYTRGHFKRGVK